MNTRKAESADVALVLEGTFPYVSGGVSSWINQIIRAYPEIRFAIVFLGSRREDYQEFKYQLPDNVVHFEEHYLYANLNAHHQPAKRSGDREAFALIDQLIDALHQGPDSPQTMEVFRQVALQMRPGGRLQMEDFLYSQRAWEIICNVYRDHCSDPSFVDFFWTVRIMFQPLWLLARVATALIPVRVVHCASTGYAGFLGGLLSYFRQMWIHFFEWIGRYCYASADPIIALYEANRLRQVADGAAPERTFNIPNGIELARFAPLRAQRPATPPPVLCLIGRVVPIKDIKTFVRAMRRVANELPGAEGWIAGPADEDPAYAEECQSLVRSLGLEKNIRFLGFQKVEDLMPRIGLVVLSSISEALPLVLLEGYAAGVPAVSTDVGSCRQLVEGLDAADQALGPSGKIVPIADPQQLADAALSLLSDPAAWQAASNAAIARVERYYTDTMMFDRYRAVYEKAFLRARGAH